MGKGMLSKQIEVWKDGFESGRETGMQEMWDYIVIALGDSEVMGEGKALIRADLDRILSSVSKSNIQYAKASTSHKEADYIQECLDKNVREIWGEDLPPYRMRYPYYKQYGYDKSRKDWK